jgi:antitoxin component of MazEF toxin-antitoxin module
MSTIIKADASGAVALPAELCREVGIEPGGEVVVAIRDQRIVAAPLHPTLAERIVARAQTLPPEVLEKMPVDGASQHDHYIYGTPKRPE